ncbi:hypothetical protein FRB94_003914 [Tulasnella sp. JGI-2019a]|nr:hypothetical protein FRB94_003914 [Tulasnella sp. JGI-2019a]
MSEDEATDPSGSDSQGQDFNPFCDRDLFGADCTFLQGVIKHAPPKAYTRDLEERVELLEKLIRRVMPHVDIDAEVGPSFNRHTWEAVKGASQPTRLFQPPASQVPSTSASDASTQQATASWKTKQSLLSSVSSVSQRLDTPEASASPGDNEDSDDERNLAIIDDEVTDDWEIKMAELHLTDTTEKLFVGKSSGETLFQAARILQREVSSSMNTVSASSPYLPDTGASRRKFWKPHPWEQMTVALPAIESLRFPPPDLIRILIDHCFSEVMPLTPLIHRPSFERQYAEGRASHDIDFARLLLLVCAVGSWYCDDPRICLTSSAGEVEWDSAGWMYFAQVYQMPKPLFAITKLVDLQIMVLSATYLEGTSACVKAWLVNGSGLRFAEDIGAHREKVYSPTQAFENQLWKRAFWCLVQKDRELSTVFGRVMGIYDEDIDAYFPLEVDDDGWDEATQEWKQSTGKPSQLAYFTQHAKLMKILAHCLRTLYSIHKSKIDLGFVGPEWEQDKVAELDSALNEWLDAVPDHLKWDQHMDPAFSKQAAALRITFHYTQLTIHRPFIQLSCSSKRGLFLPSLAVCANAARSCAHILDTIVGMPPTLLFTMMALQSGFVLMISIWEARRSGLNVDISGQVRCVQSCLNYLKRREHRHHLSGRLYDILRQIAAIGPVSVATEQQSGPPQTGGLGNGTSTKRAWDQDVTDHEHRSEVNVGRPENLYRFMTKLGSGSCSYSVPLPTVSSSKRSSWDFPQQTGVGSAFSATNQEAAIVATGRPSNQMPPSNVRNTDNLSTIPTTWENDPISNLGLGISFQGLPGYYETEPMVGAIDATSSDSFWRELLGRLTGSEEGVGGYGPTML